jgi:hypothetical protein
LQFGNVPEIIERERIIGIEQVSLVKEGLGLLVGMLADFFDALLIQPLHGRQLAALRQGNFKILRLGYRHPSHTYADYCHDEPTFPRHAESPHELSLIERTESAFMMQKRTNCLPLVCRRITSFFNNLTTFPAEFGIEKQR